MKKMESNEQIRCEKTIGQWAVALMVAQMAIQWW